MQKLDIKGQDFLGWKLGIMTKLLPFIAKY